MIPTMLVWNRSTAFWAGEAIRFVIVSKANFDLFDVYSD